MAKAVRAKIPADMPLFFRVSATDWHDRGEKDSQGNWISWGPEQTIELVKQLQPLGVDLIGAPRIFAGPPPDSHSLDVGADTSSGGNYSAQKISLGPSYQVPFAKEIKAAVPTMLVGAVGLLTEAKQIEDHLQNGDADVAFLARQFLRDPNFRPSSPAITFGSWELTYPCSDHGRLRTRRRRQRAGPVPARAHEDVQTLERKVSDASQIRTIDDKLAATARALLLLLGPVLHPTVTPSVSSSWRNSLALPRE